MHEYSYIFFLQSSIATLSFLFSSFFQKNKERLSREGGHVLVFHRHRNFDTHHPIPSPAQIARLLQTRGLIFIWEAPARSNLHFNRLHLLLCQNHRGVPWFGNSLWGTECTFSNLVCVPNRVLNSCNHNKCCQLLTVLVVVCWFHTSLQDKQGFRTHTSSSSDSHVVTYV